MERPVTAAIAGLGNRGNDIYAHYQLVAPEEMKVVAVADPVAGKREAAREEYGVAPENCFETVEDLLKQPKLADILVIATQDKQHVAQAVEAVKGLVDVALVRNTASLMGIREISQRGDAVLLYPEVMDMARAGSLAVKLRGRVLVSAGSKPYITVKMQKGAQPLDTIREALAAMKDGREPA